MTDDVSRRALFVAACLATVMFTASAHALVPITTFTVNSTVDAPDAVLDGVCATAAGECTLRAAIQESNHLTVTTGRILLQNTKYTLKLLGAGEDEAATGDLDITRDVAISGETIAKTVIQGKKDRVLDVFGASVGIFDLTIKKGSVGKKGDVDAGQADGDEVSGGGIRNNGGTLNMINVVVTGNKASHEGGGITSTDGDIFMKDVTVSKNTAIDDDGGGVQLSGGDVEMSQVTFNGNKAGDQAGAIEVSNGAELILVNATISGNASKDEAGALHNQNGGTIALTNVTIKGNKTKEGGGGLDVDGSAGNTFLRNVLLDKNKPVNCRGTLILRPGNKESGASCGFPGADSNLKLLVKGLKLNGGATKTHALKAGSPAIDSGDDTKCPTEDQRGRDRVDVPNVGTTTCDSGAFEFLPEP